MDNIWEREGKGEKKMSAGINGEKRMGKTDEREPRKTDERE